MTPNYLESIWYHSEPSDVSYSLNQFLALDFFAASYCKTVLAEHFLMLIFVEDG
jgi:hypothetical protein